MNIENAERARDILKYMQNIDEEFSIWDTVTGIESIQCNTMGGPHTFTGQFDLAVIRNSRIHTLKRIKDEYTKELEDL